MARSSNKRLKVSLFEDILFVISVGILGRVNELQ